MGRRLPLRRPLPHGRGARSGALGGRDRARRDPPPHHRRPAAPGRGNDLWLVGIGKTQRAGFLTDALSGAQGGRRRRGRTAGQTGRSVWGTASCWPSPPPAGAGPWCWTGRASRSSPGPPPRLSAIARPSSPATCAPTPPTCPCGWTSPPAPWAWTTASCPLQGARPWPAWVPDPNAVRPVIEAVLASYGGVHAYNAPLYAVDRLVRLSRRDVEARYPPHVRPRGRPPPGRPHRRPRPAALHLLLTLLPSGADPRPVHVLSLTAE